MKIQKQIYVKLDKNMVQINHHTIQKNLFMVDLDIGIRILVFIIQYLVH